MNLDFTNTASKYSLLDSNDITLLNNFFNQQDILDKLEEIEKWRKMIFKVWSTVSVIWILAIAVIMLLWNNIPNFQNISSFVTIWIWIIIIGTRIRLNYKYTKVNIKHHIMPKFVEKLGKDIKYSPTGWLLDDNTVSLVEKKIISSYDREDFVEDSIKFNVSDSITISWAEIQTSNKHTTHTKNGTQTRYVVNNHCYIIKIQYKNPKLFLKNWIRIKKDTNENSFYMTLIPTLPTIFVMWLIIFLATSQSFHLGIINYIILFIWLYTIFYFITKHIKGKNRTKMENHEFEKKFDVYCDDEIESRMILTPSFMFRILDYVSKISDKRVYEIHFFEDVIYVKFDIQSSWIWSYMEFSMRQNVKENLAQYVEFYVEIKNILSLVEDLNLIYLDKNK